MKEYQQYDLRTSDDSHHLTCWLEAGRLREGDQVTLPDIGDDIWWTVTKVYSIRQNEDQLNKGGHNSEKWYKNDFLGKFGNKK